MSEPDFPVTADFRPSNTRELRSMFDLGDISPSEALRLTFDRIHQLEPRLNCVTRVSEDKAFQQAKEAERRLLGEGASPTPLTGVPILLKDNISTAGDETTAGSQILKGYMPPYDAYVTERLKAAGAVIVGKANMDEFAMGSSNETSAFGPVMNPWDETRAPGGSSGGCAAAVAAGEILLALGSDTGGSIRQPASLCGVSGMKPTYGLVSRFGLIAFASSLDQIGPIAKDVMDCALALETIWGRDVRDATSLDAPSVRLSDALKSGTEALKGLRVAVPSEYLKQTQGSGTTHLEPGVRSAFESALSALEDAGGRIEEVSLPMSRYSLEAYYVIAPAEASANLARYDGVKYGPAGKGDMARDGMASARGTGFGAEVKRRIFIGAYVLSEGYRDAWYKKAQQVRTLIRREFSDAFKKFDLIATPTSPTVAFRLRERANDPLAMYRSDICTVPANMAGLPSISIPCGFSEELPVGLQIMGPRMADAKVMAAAWGYQQITDWHNTHPPIAGNKSRTGP